MDMRESARASALATRMRILVRRLGRAFREQGGLGQVNWSQLSVLMSLDGEGPGTVTALARAEGMRPQSMSAIISDLEASGLVSGASDPSDGRRAILSLTSAGRDVLETSRAARQDWLTSRIDERLAEDEREQLAIAMELLERLVAHDHTAARFNEADAGGRDSLFRG